MMCHGRLSRSFFQKPGFENCRIDSYHTHREAIEAIEAVEDNVIKEAAKGGVVKELLKATWSRKPELLLKAVWPKKLLNSRSKKLLNSRSASHRSCVRQLSNNQSFVQKVRGDR